MPQVHWTPSGLAEADGYGQQLYEEFVWRTWKRKSATIIEQFILITSIPSQQNSLPQLGIPALIP